MSGGPSAAGALTNGSPLARLGRAIGTAETAIPAAALVAMAVLPIAEMLARPLAGRGIPGAGPIVQHLTLLVGFLGAALAAREGRLLSLAPEGWLGRGRWGSLGRGLVAAVGAGVAALLARACLDLVLIEREAGGEVTAGLQVWVAQLVLPVSFALIALRLVWRASGGPAAATPVDPVPAADGAPGPRDVAAGPTDGVLEPAPGQAAVVVQATTVVEPPPPPSPPPSSLPRTDPIATWLPRLLGALGLGIGVWLGQVPGMLESKPAWPGLLVVLAATVLGAPLFALLGGVALLLFLADGIPIAAVPAETYRLAVQPTLPAIPLFTLAGYLLAEGKAAVRLLRVFRAWVGWIPGGTAVVCALLCAFFTAFTGGSGVTILALGALLYQALVHDGYSDRFAIGLLTSAGSLGLLFAPSLPLILYGIVAKVPIEQLFLAGILPGLLLVGMTAAWGVREGVRTGAGRARFVAAEAGRALWGAKWELLIPALVLGAMLSGWATVVEAAALTVLYVLVVQTAVTRDLGWRDLGRVLAQCIVVVGGVLVILGAAMGFSSYLVDAQVPARLSAWALSAIGSPLVFLLVLNVFLLIVGCLMDIFSAIVVVVPLIVPLGVAFGIDPLHLGVVFIANLELGYLTPPVGMNLFLASYRFERPMLAVTRAALPWLLLRGIGVLLLTYLAFLSTTLPRLLGE